MRKRTAQIVQQRTEIAKAIVSQRPVINFSETNELWSWIESEKEGEQFVIRWGVDSKADSIYLQINENVHNVPHRGFCRIALHKDSLIKVVAIDGNGRSTESRIEI